MSRFDDLYRFGRDDVLTDEALNRRFRDLDDRLSKAEAQRLSETEAFAVVLDRVLARSETVIGGLRDQLLAITQLQWLTALSETPRTLEIDGQFALIIVEADRALFAPGPFAVLTWSTGGPEDYALVRTLSFDRALGQWDVKVEAFFGEAGPHGQWQIAAVAGSTLAQLALLDQGKAAAVDAVGAAEDVEGRHADVVGLHADVVALAGDAEGAGSFNVRITALEAAQAVADSEIATLRARSFFFNRC